MKMDHGEAAPLSQPRVCTESHAHAHGTRHKALLQASRGLLAGFTAGSTRSLGVQRPGAHGTGPQAERNLTGARARADPWLPGRQHQTPCCHLT